MESKLEVDIPFEVRGPDINTTLKSPFVVRGPDICDTPPFVVRGPDICDTPPFVVRGPDICDTPPFIVRGPDICDTPPFVVRGPDIGGSLGIAEKNLSPGDQWKENTSLCSSGVSSMSSSLTSSGDLATESTLQVPITVEYREYVEHSDDDDSRLYGSEIESRFSNSVEVNFPSSQNLTITKPLDTSLMKTNGKNPGLKPNQTINTSADESQSRDSIDILRSFSQLSVSDTKPNTKDSVDVVKQDIRKYTYPAGRACEVDEPDFVTSGDDRECNEGILTLIQSFTDKYRITERGKNTKQKKYYDPGSQFPENLNDSKQGHLHGRHPYTRHSTTNPSIEDYRTTFTGSQYGNVTEVVQQFSQLENDNTHTNHGYEDPPFVHPSELDVFLQQFPTIITNTHEQVVRGPPSVLPSFPNAFGTYHTNQGKYNQRAQYVDTLKYRVSQTQHNEVWNNQCQIQNPVAVPPPHNPSATTTSNNHNVSEDGMNHFSQPIYSPMDPSPSTEGVRNDMINNWNNTCNNQSYTSYPEVTSPPTRPPMNGLNPASLMYAYHQGPDISTRRVTESHSSPSTSDVPSSPASSYKSLPSPSSQTSMKSPAMLQADSPGSKSPASMQTQSPGPFTPEGNIPNIINQAHRSVSVYSSNSSLSSGQSSSSAKSTWDESPRSLDNTLQGNFGKCSVTQDYPHPTYYGSIPEVEVIDEGTVEKSEVSESVESKDDNVDDDGNTPVHDLAYLTEDEFEVEYEKFTLKDNGSELRRSVNVMNAYKRTPLYVAVIRNNIIAVKRFLDQGADPTKFCHRRLNNERITYYENVLHLACEKGLEEMVDLLVDHPSRRDLVNSRRQGDDKTPLLICLHVHDINRNRLGIIRKLLRNQADLTLKETHSGKSPLMLAIEKHEIDLVKEELDKLNPDYRRELLQHTDYDGNTCLHFSAQISTHPNLKPLTDHQVRIFNSCLNLGGANIDATNLEKVKPKDLRRDLIALPRGKPR